MQISIYANVGRVYNNTCIFMYWANTWDFGTYRICEQWRLRRDCASAQSRQSLLCSHTWSKNQTSSNTRWLSMRIWRMHLRRTKSTIISCDGSYVFWLLDYETVHVSPVWIRTPPAPTPTPPNPHSPKNYRGKVQATVNISKHGLAQALVL